MPDLLEKRIISRLQGDLPLTPTPYADLALELGLGEAELIAKISELREKGLLRRIGAVLNHHSIGFSANAMGAWQVPPERVQEVGRLMTAFSAASHVYERPTYPDWPYNLFTMLHARTRNEVEKTAGEISRQTGINDYLLLYSTREFKKVSMNYF